MVNQPNKSHNYLAYVNITDNKIQSQSSGQTSQLKSQSLPYTFGQPQQHSNPVLSIYNMNNFPRNRFTYPATSYQRFSNPPRGRGRSYGKGRVICQIYNKPERMAL